MRRGPAWLWLSLLLVGYLILNFGILGQTVRDPEKALKMQSKDSRQYVEIAHDFADGDFSMSYVKNMPHRQPLYSLALAPVVKIWGDDLYKLGVVNIVAGLILLAGLYWGLLVIFGRYSVAVLTCLAFIANPFMVDKIASRLMTEPLYALFLTGLILLFLRYMQSGRLYLLPGIAGAAAAGYLVRPNGLFVTAAVFGALLIDECWQWRKPENVEGEKKAGASWRVKATAYLVAALVFIVVAAPSWIPRYCYFRKPVYHGYLSNFLWVDSYEQGHTGQPKSEFVWKDYASHHDLHEIAGRWASGLYHVYYDIPRHTEHVRVLYFLAVGGLIVTVLQRRRDFGLLAGCLFVQLLPVVWTSVANPGPRVPYGTMFPFELAFAALALNYLASLFDVWKAAWPVPVGDTD